MATCKAKGKGRSAPRQERTTVAIAAEEFAELVANGATLTEAFRKTHPNQTQTGVALRVKAHEFSKLPEVQENLERIRADMRERHQRFRDSLVNHLCDEIESCWQTCQSLGPVMKQVDAATRILGMDKQVVDVTAKVGPMDPSTAADRINFMAKKAKGER